MSCRILYDPMKGACFFDSMTETCFGPLMEDDDEAEAFLIYLEDHPTFRRGSSSSDPRSYVDSLLRHHFDEFRRLKNAAKVDGAAKALLVEMAKH